jgi:hypothetical protein
VTDGQVNVKSKSRKKADEDRAILRATKLWFRLDKGWDQCKSTLVLVGWMGPE